MNRWPWESGKLCNAAGPAVLAALDTLVEPMGKTLTAKLKSDAVKQEIDRNEDLLRSCLRGVAAVEKLEGAADNAAFAKFLEKTAWKRVRSSVTFTSLRSDSL